MKKFIKELEKKDYGYRIEGTTVIVTHKGHVDLSNLTIITTDVKFKNKGHVYLSSLTTIETDVVFENEGGVYLSSLTIIETDVVFKNEVYVYLPSLTTITTDVKFENEGGVDLSSLTTIETDVVFENEDYVYLNSLTDKTIKHRSKEYEVKIIDGYTMLILNTKKKDDYTIYQAKFFKGCKVEDMKGCYVVQHEDYYAHGDTIQKAITDVKLKFLQENLDVGSLEVPIDQVIVLLKGHFSSDDFKEMMR